MVGPPADSRRVLICCTCRTISGTRTGFQALVLRRIELQVADTAACIYPFHAMHAKRYVCGQRKQFASDLEC